MYEIVDSSTGDLLGRYADPETAWRKLREHVRRNPKDVNVVALIDVDDDNPLRSKVVADHRHHGLAPTPFSQRRWVVQLAVLLLGLVAAVGLLLLVVSVGDRQRIDDLAPKIAGMTDTSEDVPTAAYVVLSLLLVLAPLVTVALVERAKRRKQATTTEARGRSRSSRTR
jgi:hypothetical protein